MLKTSALVSLLKEKKKLKNLCSQLISKGMT